MKVINALSVVVERVKQYVDTALLSKVNSFQGVENKDKLLKVDEQGYVVPVDADDKEHIHSWNEIENKPFSPAKEYICKNLTGDDFDNYGHDSELETIRWTYNLSDDEYQLLLDNVEIKPLYYKVTHQGTLYEGIVSEYKLNENNNLDITEWLVQDSNIGLKVENDKLYYYTGDYEWVELDVNLYFMSDDKEYINEEAIPNTIARVKDVPTHLYMLESDYYNRTVTDEEKDVWNNKSEFSGNWNDLEDKPFYEKSSNGAVFKYSAETSEGTLVGDKTYSYDDFLPLVGGWYGGVSVNGEGGYYFRVTKDSSENIAVRLENVMGDNIGELCTLAAGESMNTIAVGERMSSVFFDFKDGDEITLLISKINKDMTSEIIKQLDEKFIPDTIATKEDVDGKDTVLFPLPVLRIETKTVGGIDYKTFFVNVLELLPNRLYGLSSSIIKKELAGSNIGTSNIRYIVKCEDDTEKQVINTNIHNSLCCVTKNTNNIMLYHRTHMNECFVIYTNNLTTANNVTTEIKRNRNYLNIDNAYEFTPTSDYHPATKKYVDDSSSSISNEVSNTYETKEDAIAKLDEAKLYANEQIENHNHSFDNLEDKPFGNMVSPMYTFEFVKDEIVSDQISSGYFGYTPDNSVEIGQEIFSSFKNIGISLNQPSTIVEDGTVKLKVTFTYNTYGVTEDVVELPNCKYQVMQVGATEYAFMIQDVQFGNMPICGFAIGFTNGEVSSFRYIMTNFWANGSWDAMYEFTGTYQNYGYLNNVWMGKNYKFEAIVTPVKKLERKYLDLPTTEQTTSTLNMKKVAIYGDALYSQYPPNADGYTYGLVKPVSKTSAMTKEVGISNGKLYTAPDIDFTPTADDNGKFLRIVDGKIVMENYNPSAEIKAYVDEAILGGEW